MRQLLRIAFSPAGPLIAAAIAFAIGLYMIWIGNTEKLPERSEMTVIQGVVTQVFKETTERRGHVISTKYRVHIASNQNNQSTIILQGDQITDGQATAMAARTISAEARRGDPGDIWAFAVAGTPVFTFEDSRKKRAAYLAYQAAQGPNVVGFGAILALIGGVWLHRRRAKAAAQVMS